MKTRCAPDYQQLLPTYRRNTPVLVNDFWFFFPHESYYTAQRTYYDNYIIIVVSSGTGSHTDTHILSGMYPARTPAPSTRLDDDYADVSLNGCADDHPTGRWRRENENTTNRYCLAQRPMYKLYNTRVTRIQHDIIHTTTGTRTRLPT